VWKGAKLYAVDVETGEEVWSSLSFDVISGPALHDGYMIWFNGYDNQIYCYNKGPSAIDVTASPKVSVQGSGVLIEGMVTDESPGTKTSLLTARFPNGVPAISDEDQSAWMEHLYQQQLRPADATGVTVTLDTIDPNGNFVHIGETTTDSSGLFKLLWTPDVPGEYTVIATFPGSESYYASFTETAIGVEEAPEPTPPPEATPAPMTDTYVLGLGIAAIIAIVVMGLLILMKLGKK
jgi:hypothetical protein